MHIYYITYEINYHILQLYEIIGTELGLDESYPLKTDEEEATYQKKQKAALASAERWLVSFNAERSLASAES